MKKVFEFFKNWFQKNGLIKLLVAFVILIVSGLLYRTFPQARWLNVVGIISVCYLILSIAVFLFFGISNSIKDIKDK